MWTKVHLSRENAKVWIKAAEVMESGRLELEKFTINNSKERSLIVRPPKELPTNGGTYDLNGGRSE
ncbi:MAG: hypothetical protein ACTS4V_00245 [Candidatus Hodgkinia cicadicola]